MHLSGQLSDWSIHDLLQIMQVTKKTGSLDIEGERRGRIHFRNGTVTGAELTGIKGSYVGSDRGAVADILYVLSTLDVGSFSVGPADGPEAAGWAVEDVIQDVDALRHIEGEVVDAGLFEAAGLRLTQNIDEPLAIDPEDWAVLVSLVPPFTFSQLEARMGRGGAVRVFHTLHRLGAAETVDHVDDEASLLGTVAGSVAGEPTWLEQKADEALTPAIAATAADGEVEVTDLAASQTEPETEPESEPETEPVALETVALDESEEALLPPLGEDHHPLRGVSAPASTTLTDGVYDEIRRLRSKVAER